MVSDVDVTCRDNGIQWATMTEWYLYTDALLHETKHTISEVPSACPL